MGVQERVVGRVVGLWRYPVKSMAGEALDDVEVSWHGLAGDRRWAFVREGQVQSGFPWLTGRRRADMLRYQPSFVDPERPDTSVTVVRAPSGQVVDVTDPLLGAELGSGARVLRQDRGVFDVMPLSLLTTGSVAAVEQRVGPLAPLRFRPNLLVDAEDGAFAEDGWVGAALRVGELGMRVDQRDQRCMMVNLDPATAERDPTVLRSIARDREACLGVYGSVVRPGRVRLGDSVVLVEGAPAPPPGSSA